MIFTPCSDIQSDTDRKQSFFRETAIDIGTVRNNHLLSVKFEYQNNTGNTIVIEGVKKNCGCMEVIFPKRPIKPLQKGVVKIKINLINQKGIFRKTALIYAKGLPPTILKITGKTN